MRILLILAVATVVQAQPQLEVASIRPSQPGLKTVQYSGKGTEQLHVKYASYQLGQNVVNATGIEGNFRYELKWTSDASQLGPARSWTRYRSSRPSRSNSDSSWKLENGR